MHKPRTGTCLNCGNVFTFYRCHQRQQQFCVNTCYQDYRKKTSFRPCKRCGKPVSKKTNLTFCSNACFGKAERRPRQVFTCNTCGNEYIRKGFTKKSQWCSRACKHTFEERPCLQCGSVFRVQRWEKNIRRFCSQGCGLRFQGETSIEKIVRESLESLGLFFIPQHQVGRYFADFFLPLMNVAIEADGIRWHSGQDRIERDTRRDIFFLARGIHTIRLPEAVIRSTQNLAELIARKLHLKIRK